MTDEQIKAFRIADNSAGQIAQWDLSLLEQELANIDYNMMQFGLQEQLEQIQEQLEQSKTIEEDDFDIDSEYESIKEPKTKIGDIWNLGEHRLMCGDSTRREDIEKLTNGEKIDLVFTDPPYGMNAVSKSGVLSKSYKTDILNDDTNEIAIESFLLCKDVFKDTKQIWWGSNYYTDCLPSAECWIVWDKNNGESDQTDCELAWTNFRSVVRQFTLASEKKNRVHPTQKPIRLIHQILCKFDKEKSFNHIFDGFGGSGSTLIACEQLNKKCFMMELDPKYCDVIIKRWETLTGNIAQLIKEN